jgi:hypothetical protein
VTIRQLFLALFSFVLIMGPSGTVSSAPRGAAFSAVTVELSAEAKKDDKNKNKNKNQGQQHNKQKSIQQNQKSKNFKQKQNVQQKQNINKKQINVQQQKKFEQQQFKKQNVQKTQKKFTGQPKKFTPKHNHTVLNFKLNNANHASFHGKNYTVYRRDYRVRHNGRWRTFVGLGLLAPLLIGVSEFYPYAYLDVPDAYCEGLTEDGCELVYDDVETLDGDLIPQCVAYCPWQ